MAGPVIQLSGTLYDDKGPQRPPVLTLTIDGHYRVCWWAHEYFSAQLNDGIITQVVASLEHFLRGLKGN